MPVSRNHRLVVLGGERVGKTAIIEQFIFGNHVIGQVGYGASLVSLTAQNIPRSFQGGLPTLGDVYEATVETEKGPSEKLHIFDTPGSVRSHVQELIVHEITIFCLLASCFQRRGRNMSRNTFLALQT